MLDKSAAKAPDIWKRATNDTGIIGSDFVAALEDDLNTPHALAILHAMVDGVFPDGGGGSDEGKALSAAEIRHSASLLGLLQQDPEAWFKGASGGAAGGLGDAAIDDLIAQRIAARKSKNFAEADRIRKLLADSGVVLEDGAQGTTWRRA